MLSIGLEELEYYAIGKLGLKPWNIKNIDLYTICHWIDIHVRIEEEELDKKMILLSWQTSLLMNATGNFKKKIKPFDLYTPLNDIKRKKSSNQCTELKEKLQQDLLDTFDCSKTSIK